MAVRSDVAHLGAGGGAPGSVRRPSPAPPGGFAEDGDRLAESIPFLSDLTASILLSV